jgi:LacI family transcriptional regulator
MINLAAMSQQRKTVEDVARAAGVSLMTVSRAINGRPGVSEETRRVVIAIAEEMGYRPSRLASGLASRSASSFGIVLPDMANPYFATLAKAATDVAREAGLPVFVMNTDEDPALELAAYDALNDERINGLVVSGSRLPHKKLEEAMRHFRASVLVNSALHGEGIVNVDVDDKRGVEDIVAYLRSTGRRRIGFVAGPRESTSGRRRLAGLKASLRLHDVPFDAGSIERCIPNMEGGRKAVISLLERRPRLDAVIAYNDVTAIGILRGLEEAGRRVPADIAVVGVDDIAYAALVHPALTTLRVDIAALGRMAMTSLLDLRGGRPAPRWEPLRPELVIRESA